MKYKKMKRKPETSRLREIQLNQSFSTPLEE